MWSKTENEVHAQKQCCKNTLEKMRTNSYCLPLWMLFAGERGKNVNKNTEKIGWVMRICWRVKYERRVNKNCFKKEPNGSWAMPSYVEKVEREMYVTGCCCHCRHCPCTICSRQSRTFTTKEKMKKKFEECVERDLKLKWL